MIYYIKNETLGTSNDLPAEAVEITKEQYKEALQSKQNGHKVAVVDGAMKIFSKEKRTVYSTEDGSKKEILKEEDTPDGYTDNERPTEYHQWIDDEWVLTSEKEAEKLEDERKQIESQRQRAYRNRSDPIFMKWQRGEATEQEWIDEVEAIRAEFPYPEETTG